MTSPTPSPTPGVPGPRPSPASFGAASGGRQSTLPGAATFGTRSPHEEAPTGDEVRTGDAEIDAALDELADLGDRPLRDHIAAGERVHSLLQARLGDLGGS
jgi:hypothetical protein